MRITTQKIVLDLDKPSKSVYCSERNPLIFDIETTGFSKEHAIIYMIGCIYKKNDFYEYCNILAHTPEEEREIINYFFDLIKNFDCIIHFNGNNFDIPFLLERAKMHKLNYSINHIESVDIYQLLRPFRKHLNLPNLRLDTIQEALGYNRQDIFTGGELIQVYYNYTISPQSSDYDILLLHNKEDVEGMIYLMPLIDIFLLIDKIITTKCSTVSSINIFNNKIHIVYTIPYKFYIDLTLSFNDANVSFISTDNTIEFIIPVQSTTKKMFFENHNDYVYIPDRDEAIHKSIARFMTSHKKVKANKKNCYVPNTGLFIPLFGKMDNKKIFKDSYNDKELFVALNEELDADFYIEQLINFLSFCKGL